MLVGASTPLPAQASLLCKSSSDQITPDRTKIGQPTVIQFIVETAGEACGPIRGKFTDFFLHYKLTGQDKYTTLPARTIPLPQNYQNVASTAMQFEAYEFEIPPYPRGTAGQIEYYIESKLNGEARTTNGYKKITIVSSDSD